MEERGAADVAAQVMGLEAPNLAAAGAAGREGEEARREDARKKEERQHWTRLVQGRKGTAFRKVTSPYIAHIRSAPPSPATTVCAAAASLSLPLTLEPFPPGLEGARQRAVPE